MINEGGLSSTGFGGRCRPSVTDVLEYKRYILSPRFSAEKVVMIIPQLLIPKVIPPTDNQAARPHQLSIARTS
jgi:hypothetical protein